MSRYILVSYRYLYIVCTTILYNNAFILYVCYLQIKYIKTFLCVLYGYFVAVNSIYLS